MSQGNKNVDEDKEIKIHGCSLEIKLKMFCETRVNPGEEKAISTLSFYAREKGTDLLFSKANRSFHHKVLTKFISQLLI